MDNEAFAVEKPGWLDRPVSPWLPKFTLYHLLITLIIIAAVVTRFYNVGLRVMAHDEVNHVVPSYDLYQGRGYAHDPITHGPLQFHLLAASYFLFGDSDVSSRIPAALFSIATVIFVLFAFRRYLGRTGALLSGLFFLISPYMMFYGRYTRNEAFVALFGVVMLYAVLRYLETGRHSALYLFTIVLALHFATKETAFIYTAQLLIFLAILLIRDVTRMEWKTTGSRDLFQLVMLAAILMIGVALGAGVLDSSNSATTNATAVLPGVMHYVLLVSLGLAAISAIAAIVILLKGLGWQVVKQIRSFDLLLLTGTMVLPQLIAFPISIAGWNPLDYSQPGLLRTSLFLLGAVLIALALGLLWKPRLWLVNVAIFYAIFTVFYTTFFTNGQGFFTGLVGSLGYWLSQQGVNRGSQPWYFFVFLQVPMYEYLAALGAILAFIIGIKRKLFSTIPGRSPADQVDEIEPAQEQLELPVVFEDEPLEPKPVRLPVLSLLLYWSVLSLVAYTLAGEKMPWLTVHITLPMLLCAGFGFGYLVETTPFEKLTKNKGYLVPLLIPVFLVSLGAVLAAVTGANRPFAGKELEQLKTTSTFLFSLIAFLSSGWLLWKLLFHWRPKEMVKLLTVGAALILAVLTARSAFQANFINYDTAKEFLVYAHAARGPKDVLEEVEDISKRLTGGKEIKVAYIGDALYPYWWYFRDYPNKTWLKDDLTRDLLNYPVIITDDEHYSKTMSIVKDNFTETKYKRLWWPMQDYFNMTWARFWKGFTNPEMRQAIFNIWLNKDYSLYASLTNNTGLTLENWQPSGNIYLLIKKDIVSQIWSYGTLPVQVETTTSDPYAGKYVELTPDKILGSAGSAEGQLSYPRGIAVSPSGLIYVADSQNHRIQKFSADGEYLSSWGTYAIVDTGNAPGGTFNEPWGIAVAPDGNVFVADTWNHRIQKFTADGKFITMWGAPGLAESPTQFWGPRGIAVDSNGLVYVTDTGNNRVVIFDEDGNFQTQFGTNGVNPGELDEPVGIAVDTDGSIYIADTWNQRIQVFEPDGKGNYQFLRQWEVNAWSGQSVNNKPFLTLDGEGHVFITDPDAFRVLEFDTDGNIIRGWGDASSGIDGFGSPCGIVVDKDGRVWVTDAENNFALGFLMPAAEMVEPQAGAGLPAIPEGLTLNQEDESLYNDLATQIYQLDKERSEWVPVIPFGISTLIDPQTTPEKDANGDWVISNTDGTTRFVWDAGLQVWVSMTP